MRWRTDSVSNNCDHLYRRYLQREHIETLIAVEDDHSIHPKSNAPGLERICTDDPSCPPAEPWVYVELEGSEHVEGQSYVHMHLTLLNELEKYIVDCWKKWANQNAATETTVTHSIECHPRDGQKWP